jgi:3-oxoacyl-[acyl-carrier protein] reductase
VSVVAAGVRDGTGFEQDVMGMWRTAASAVVPQDLYAARLTKGAAVVDLQLNNKVALVFGASAGLGGAIAETLAAEGARIALASLPSDSLTAAAERVGAITDAIAVPWDLADLSAIGPNIAAVERQLGPVEIIVNMTGGPPPTPASGQRPEDWSRFFTSMVVSVIAITDAVLPGMRERRWGRIITNTSSGVVVPIPNLGLSNVLRSSLVAWSKTLAREVGERNITCNIVVPGRVATSRMVQLDEAKAAREGRPVAEVMAESAASIPLGRYGDPREYADVVTFLASPRASYITGSIIRVDGGLIPSI